MNRYALIEAKKAGIQCSFHRVANETAQAHNAIEQSIATFTTPHTHKCITVVISCFLDIKV